MSRYFGLLLSLIIGLVFLMIQPTLSTIFPFYLYQADSFDYFFMGFCLGLALALVVKALPIGMMIGLMSFTLAGAIGGADEAILTLVFSSLAVWGFVFGLLFANNFLHCSLLAKHWHFVLDIA